ncbi:MAG: hypothetical protein LBQ24_06735 [Candidatus Peribacteria bacterium]|nr:hypothetical protein [Candidatus Peribacteria bacterium]
MVELIVVVTILAIL